MTNKPLKKVSSIENIQDYLIEVKKDIKLCILACV